MKLLLTNDDGIDAEGLSALLAAVRGLGEAVTVGPVGPRSGVSHAVSTDARLNADIQSRDVAVGVDTGEELRRPNTFEVAYGLSDGEHLVVTEQ